MIPLRDLWRLELTNHLLLSCCSNCCKCLGGEHMPFKRLLLLVTRMCYRFGDMKAIVLCVEHYFIALHLIKFFHM